MILHGPGLKTVSSEVLKAKRAKMPDAKLAYHDISEAATNDDPGALKITMNTKVVYAPSPHKEGTGEEDAGAKKASLQARAGCLLPMRAWKASVTGAVFACRWAPTGLIPDFINSQHRPPMQKA